MAAGPDSSEISRGGACGWESAVAASRPLDLPSLLFQHPGPQLGIPSVKYAEYGVEFCVKYGVGCGVEYGIPRFRRTIPARQKIQPRKQVPICHAATELPSRGSSALRNQQCALFLCYTQNLLSGNSIFLFLNHAITIIIYSSKYLNMFNNLAIASIAPEYNNHQLITFSITTSVSIAIAISNSYHLIYHLI